MTHPRETAWFNQASATLASICLGCVAAFSPFLVVAGQAGPALPLKVGTSGRYLADQQEQPFLVVGDTAWSLIAQLGEEDIRRYLDDRQSRGFNALIVNLIEHKFSSKPPGTRSGLQPFTQPDDFSTFNPAYFDFAHRVVKAANERGIVIWLAPAYLGYGGGDEGFFREIKAGGRDKLRAYGRYLGATFGDLPNIVWMLGGDHTPPPADRWTVTDLAGAIRESDSRHLMTAHTSPEQTAAGIYGQEPWLAVNTVYSYKPSLFEPLLAAEREKPVRPFVLIESTYEGEHDSKPEQIRRQAYWTMLSGACGHFFGNNPIWRFDGPGLFPTKLTWQEALDAPGSRDMVRLSSLFLPLPWTDLRPEENHSIVVDGFGQGTSTTLTARSPGAKLSISYIPATGTERRELTIDTGFWSGPVSGRWFNPGTGAWTDSVRIPAGVKERILTPGANGGGVNDWLLILRPADGPPTSAPITP